MKSFKTSYERKTSSTYWTFATEIIKARGLMHVYKLAHDHLKALKKLEDYPMRINRITDVDCIAED